MVRRMSKFRKKPVIVDAFQMTSAQFQDHTDWPEWLKDALYKPMHEEGCVWFYDGHLHLHAIGGTVLVSRDDWIIRGVEGELYPCKPSIFAETYEDSRRMTDLLEMQITENKKLIAATALLKDEIERLKRIVEHPAGSIA